METSIVTTKGQVVIPSRVRRLFGIKNGTRIQFEVKENEIILTPITPELIEKNFGFLGTKGNLLRALMLEKKREREF